MEYIVNVEIWDINTGEKLSHSALKAVNVDDIQDTARDAAGDAILELAKIDLKRIENANTKTS